MEKIQNALQKYRQNQIEVIPPTKLHQKAHVLNKSELPHLSSMDNSRSNRHTIFNSQKNQYSVKDGHTENSHEYHLDPFDERTAESKLAEESAELSQF